MKAKHHDSIYLRHVLRYVRVDVLYGGNGGMTMETKDECPFKPGDQVLVNDGYGNYQATTVRKVYKTGRFVLWDDPENRQWRPDGPSPYGNSKDQPTYAWPATSGSFSFRRSLMLDNEAARLLVAAQKHDRDRKAMADKLAERLDKNTIRRLPLVTIEAINKLLGFS